jgi:glycerate kinase
MKKVVVAPDSLKGSLSATDFCKAMRVGILRVLPEAEVIALPLADGGEGTMDTLVQATNGTRVSVTVSDPLGRAVQAQYGVLGRPDVSSNHASVNASRNQTESKSQSQSQRQPHEECRAMPNKHRPPTVVIELAQASGLPLLTAEERDPLLTTTYGTGELIRHALDAGHRDFLLGLGGSATNDGGAGLLEALGLRLLDAQGLPLPRGGAALARLHALDTSALDPRLQQSRFLIASDVQNPLTGPAGASAIFGPQKGATPAQVAQLDEALRRFADIVQQHLGTDLCLHTLPGGGAAGGTGAGLLAFLPCTMRSGIEVVLEAARFEEHLAHADLVLTGEGSLDSQTLSGKTIAGVCRAARRHQVPVVALCGSTALTGSALDELGVLAAFSLVPGPCTLDDALQHADSWAADRAEQVLRLLRR